MFKYEKALKACFQVHGAFHEVASLSLDWEYLLIILVIFCDQNLPIF